ncbi:MAG: LysR family transcriptional regulator [Myxococcota bacterium]
MNLDELRLFVALAEAPSLTEAGRRVGLGPGGASAALQRIEDRARVRLVERTTRSLRLTPEGERFLQTCRDVLTVWGEGEQALADARDGLAGVLRVAAPRDLADRYVAPCLAAFVAEHADVRATLVADDALHRIPADDIDLAIRYGGVDDAGLVVRRLATTERILVASPGYLAAHGLPEGPAALGSHRCVSWIRAGRAYARWTLARGTEEQTVAVRPVLCGDGAQVRRWVLDGHGIALKADLDVRRELADGSLVRVLPDWSGGAVPLVAVTPGRRFRPARVQALIDRLADEVVRWTRPFGGLEA